VCVHSSALSLRPSLVGEHHFDVGGTIGSGEQSSFPRGCSPLQWEVRTFRD